MLPFRNEIANQLHFVFIATGGCWVCMCVFLMVKTPQEPNMLFFDCWNAVKRPKSQQCSFLVVEPPQGGKHAVLWWLKRPRGQKCRFLIAETPQKPKMLFFDGCNGPGANNTAFWWLKRSREAKMLLFNCWNVPGRQTCYFLMAETPQGNKKAVFW